MKNKLKKITILSLIICILVSIFNISNVFAEEPKFILSDTSIVDKADGVDSTITSFNKDSLNTNTTFHKLNDYVEIKLTIKNTSSLKYKIKLVNDNSGNNYIDYEYKYNESEELNPNQTIDIYIKAMYKNESTDTTSREQKDNFIISLILEDEEGNIADGSINVNPNTNSSITFYKYLLVISSLLLIVSIINLKRNKKVMVLILLLSPFIVKAVAPSVVITYNNNVNLLDKIVVKKIVNGKEVTEVIDYNTKIEKPADPVVEGYNFLGWYVGDEPYDFSEGITEDTNITAKFSPIDYSITYNLDGGNVTGNPDTYNIETSTFDLVNPTKEGYTFAGWTEGSGEELQTRVTIEKGTTGNKTYTAHFSPNQNTHYRVNHKYTKLDGDYEIVEENLEGPTGTTVTPAFMSKTGFNNPDSQELLILPDGSAEIDYIYTRIEYLLTIKNIEDVDTTFENKKYPYETVITLTAKDKDHYDFIKWSNGVTTKVLSFEITKDTTVGPEYTPKEYTVTFDSQGGVSVNPITKTYNTEIGELPEILKTNYIFDGWYTNLDYTTKVTPSTKVEGNVTYYAKWRKSIKLADISSEDVNILKGTNTTISITNVDEEYTFTSNDTSVATIDSNGKITGIKKGTTTITVEGVESHLTRTINVEVYVDKYTVHFDSQGGKEVSDKEVNRNTAIGTLPKTTKENHKFEGWFTASEDGEKIDEDTVITDDITYYAHWTKLTCVAATTLHYETCTRTTGGCYQAGYREGSGKNTTTIVYGSIPNSDTINPGYAYDCDVNGDGTYNSATERFYYLTTNGDNAVLISHNDYEGENGQQNINNFAYDDIFDQLPSSSDWSNLTVKFNGKPARIPTYDELKAACGKNTLTTTGDLDRCPYLLENSRFADSVQSQEGIWLEKINGVTYRYHTNTRAVTSKTQMNTVRPVIEVPLTLIDDTYYEEVKRTVTFDSQGGTPAESITVDAYTAVGTLPTTSNNPYTFAGWFTAPDGGTRVKPNTIITDDITLYAKWDSVAAVEMNGITYSSLEDAIAEITDNTETTIKLLRDCEAQATVKDYMNIVFDLQDYTLSNSKTESVIINFGKVKISNGTIKSNGTTAAFHNNDSGVLIMTGGKILATGTKQAIYNDGGRVEISGDVYLKASSSQRATLHNLNNGVVTIKSGTIISDKQQAVNNDGSLTIGEVNGTHNVSNPILQGKTYGLTTTTNISMYDGTLKGETDAIDNLDMINNHEDGFRVFSGTDNNYKIIYYENN